MVVLHVLNLHTESVMLCCAGGAFGVLIAWLITRGISRSSSELQVGISSVGLAIAFSVRRTHFCASDPA